MTASIVETSRDGTLAIVTMNNPTRRNALSPDMRDQLITAFDEALAEKSVRAIVLCGKGGSFCAGGDISAMSTESSLLEARARMGRYHTLLRMLTTGPKPVIAAVEGHAFGAGMSLVLACDHVVAASSAKFCTAFARVGLLPDVGMFWTLPQRVGMAKAKELITLADELDGTQAGSLGIANQVVDSGAALEVALQVACRYAKVAPVAFAFSKAAFADGSVDTLEGAIRAEMDNQPMMRQTRDHLNAARAFMEKRPVVFFGE